MTMKKMMALLCAGALTVSGLSACGSSAPETKPAETEAAGEVTAPTEAAGTDNAEVTQSAGGTMKIGSIQSSATLDPTNGYDYWYMLRYGVCETLLQFDENMVPSGWLVEDDYTVSEDGMTWTFHIKDGITFSNGNPFDAAAAKATIERAQEMVGAAGAAFPAQSIEADGNTLTITTEKPIPTMPYLLADPVFVMYDTSVDLSNAIEEGVIGTGPFVFTAFDPISFNTSVVKNENYWGGDVKLDGIDFVINTDPTALSMALSNSEVDAAYGLDATTIKDFDGLADFRIELTSSMRTDFAFLNQSEGRPLQDEVLRQAIIRACDRDLYCATILNNMFVAGKTPLTAALPYGFDKITDPNAYDLAGANALLDEAGYKDIDGDGFRETPAGEPLVLTWVSYTARAELDSITQAAQIDLTDIGININLSNRDQSSAWNALTAGDFDLCCMSISMASAGDPENSLRSYFATHTEANNNYNAYGYSSEAVDALLEELSSEFDKSRRAEIITDIQTEIVNDSAVWNLCYPTINFVVKSNTSGVISHPCDYYWVDVNTCFTE